MDIDINKEMAADKDQLEMFPKPKIKWFPALIEDEDTGKLYWGDTDTPIVAIWELHEALDYLQRITFDQGHEAMKKLLEATGLRVELHDTEFVILEDKDEEDGHELC